MNPSNVILYANSLLKYYAMKKQKISNRKKQQKKKTNQIYLGKWKVLTLT